VFFVSFSFVSANKLIFSGIDRTTEQIKKRLQEAENIRNEAKKILGVNIKKLETAKNGVATILSEANKEAEMQKKKALENLNNSMERNKDQLQDRIQKNEKETIEKLKRIISTISISASESFLKNNIDEKLHNQLIENSLSELPKKIQ
ncbi:MAG: hypothetical protein VX645_02480, partial [Pseudomonadota bacterium]|nr:hypothetical protein [Pseudomonadota bacterium]